MIVADVTRKFRVHSIVAETICFAGRCGVVAAYPPILSVNRNQFSVDSNHLQDSRYPGSLGRNPCEPVIPAMPSMPAVVVVHVLSPSSVDSLRRVTVSAENSSRSARTGSGLWCTRQPQPLPVCGDGSVLEHHRDFHRSTRHGEHPDICDPFING